MFIELDLTVNGRRSLRMINTDLIEEIILGENALVILFVGGERANLISYELTPDNRAFYDRLYSSLKGCLIYSRPELNGINVIRL